MSSGKQMESEIAALLRQEEAAHGAYETTVLAGARDEDWAAWYAAYLLDLGAANALLDLPDVPGLSKRLIQLDTDFRREQPTIEWPEFYARRLIAARP